MVQSKQGSGEEQPAAAGRLGLVHALVALVSTVATLACLGELDFLVRPQASAPEAATALADAITPSPWLLRRTTAQFKANWKRILLQRNGTMPTATASAEMLFQSPIFRVSLRDMDIDPNPITMRVAQIVLREYYKLVNSSKDSILDNMERENRMKEAREQQAAAKELRRLAKGEKDDTPRIAAASSGEDNADGGSDEDGDTSLLNDAFFVWQSESGGWEEMFGGNEALLTIKSFWARAADSFLRTLGHASVFEGKAQVPELQAWATVHKDCVFHGAHHHGEDIMSGVFYVQIPEGSGKISFYDPRGIHSPFVNRINVMPRPGDIVLFPTSLVHQVQPTQSHVERISIAVNLVTTGGGGRGADAMPTGLLNDPETIAVPPLLGDEWYTILE
jgi:hypothetical protein